MADGGLAGLTVVNHSLHVLTDEQLSRGRATVVVVQAALAGGATVIQLRDKTASTRRLLELVRKNPKTQVAADALIWVVTNDRYGENLDEALEILLQDHVEDEKLGQVAQMLVYSNAKHPETALEILLQKNPHHEVQGKATFSLGLVNRSHDKNAEAEKLFEQVIDRFGGIQNYRGTLADAARGQLFEMRNLAIGKIAPEIEGEDLDGKSFKLSDYRGKIVVLDFWGDW